MATCYHCLHADHWDSYLTFEYKGSHVKICSDCSYPAYACAWFDEDVTDEEIHEEIQRQVKTGKILLDNSGEFAWDTPR